MQRKTVIAQMGLGAMAVAYFLLGVYIRCQMEEIESIRLLLKLATARM